MKCRQAGRGVCVKEETGECGDQSQKDYTEITKDFSIESERYGRNVCFCSMFALWFDGARRVLPPFFFLFEAHCDCRGLAFIVSSSWI